MLLLWEGDISSVGLWTSSANRTFVRFSVHQTARF
jgi:hypothetical protein